MPLATGIVIFLPPEAQAVAAPLERQYALESLIRVPPHISVLIPFVPYDQLDQALLTLQAIGAETEAFSITLQGYDHFPGVIFMNPVNPDPIKGLFRKISAAFPTYLPYDGRHGNDLHPHVTVAEFEDDDQRQQTTLPEYAPITFRVERFHIVYGMHSDDEVLPWLTYAVVPLNG
ncbi:MAG: 2'-5' RNA ligase family protein [Anaerolineae bacterium]